MAEGRGAENKKNTLPQRGKVQQVRKEWSVFEDGAMAYQLQNEEIDRHYGLNRFNRRTVREDIPIAKIVQDDEEYKQQNERFQQLQALRAQAEEDERVAKQMMEKEQLQIEAHRMAVELTDENDERIAKQLMEEEKLQLQAKKLSVELNDEEFAKSVQEKEKQKYERYLEKKKMKKLKKEKEEIEKKQQMMTEQARLSVRGSQEDLEEQMSEMNMRQNGAPGMRYNYRVTTDGKIEDDGDFSDFYNLPENVDPAHRQAIQEIQDEELAKLIQEQEHKRSKAEVDRMKLKEIEEQDKRLAEIMQEQEKLRLKKALAKRKQQDEAKKAQEQAQRPPALPPRNDHDHRRYRRNSFILSMENGPEGEEEDPNFDPASDYMTPVQVAAEQRLQGSGDQRAFSASVRQNSRGDQRPINTRQNSQPNMGTNNSRQQPVNSACETQQNAKNMKKVQNDLRFNANHSRNANPAQIPSDSMPDVERWLASQPQAPRGRLRSDESDHLPESPSPGSYHSDDAFPYPQGHPSRVPPHNTSVDNSSHYAVSDPFNFNIATAIDPTYTRRSNEGTTERKVPVHQVTNSLPSEVCSEIEWDPNVRGSIRRGSLSRLHASSCFNQGYEDYPAGTTSSRGDSFHGDDSGIISPFVPVQGQRRGGDKSRKTKKAEPISPTAKQKNNCKQQ